FYADHTFEVDFIKGGNSFEVKNIVQDVYTDQKTIRQAIEEIQNDEVAIFGQRVLRMANNVGKGWFAILLGKTITELTEIPEYIMEALIFAKEEYSNCLLADIIENRVKIYEFGDEYNIDFSDLYVVLEKYRNGEEILNNIIDMLDGLIGGDQIVTFLNIYIRD
ncbi:ATP-dependent endonuclease, partial [Acinetobacter oleivorans]|nr:ATP-dependent endonuclease [Acinetobacter oleivorans]